MRFPPVFLALTSAISGESGAQGLREIQPHCRFHPASVTGLASDLTFTSKFVSVIRSP